MPKNSKVGRCFDKLRHKKGDASAAKICQASTGQSLATGKPSKKKRNKAGGAPDERKRKMS